MRCSLLILVFCSFLSKASGMPVVDTARLTEAKVEMVSTLNVFLSLIDELGTDVNYLRELKELRSIIRETDEFLSEAKRLNTDLNYITDFNPYKYDVFLDRITSVTRFIKRVKRVYKLSLSAMSAKTLNAAVNSLRLEREEEDRRFATKMKIAELKFKAKKRQEKIRSKLLNIKTVLDGAKSIEKNKNNMKVFW